MLLLCERKHETVIGGKHLYIVFHHASSHGFWSYSHIDSIQNLQCSQGRHCYIGRAQCDVSCNTECRGRNFVGLDLAELKFGFQIRLAAGSFCSTSHTSHAFAVGFPVEGGKRFWVPRRRWSKTWSFRIIVQHFDTFCLSEKPEIGEALLGFPRLQSWSQNLNTISRSQGLWFSSPGELTVSLMLFGGYLTVKTHVALRVRVTFLTPANIQPVFWSHICANRTSFTILSSSKLYHHSLVRHSCLFLDVLSHSLVSTVSQFQSPTGCFIWHIQRS